jgi:hypothetical protein
MKKWFADLFTNKSKPKEVLWACDECRTHIAVGDVRYHCIECPNFDICSKCNGKGCHSAHELSRETEHLNTLKKRVVCQHLLF